jgi:hypothetical protein
MNPANERTYTLTDEDLALLYPILRTQSKSRNQQDMAAHVYSELALLGATVEYDEQTGNIYATKGEATYYPCFVAHLDTVHALIKDYDIRQYKNGDLIGWNVDTNQISGIGGDDKCGIFIALAMLRDLPAAKAAFFTDEEIGCLGAYDARMAFFDDVSFVLEADRRGNSDIIRDAAGTELYSADFQEAIAGAMAEHGFAEAYGSITDVMTLKENGLAVSCLNMSAGYHNAHTPQEIVRPADLARALSFARGITNAASGQQWPHTYTRKVTSSIKWWSEKTTKSYTSVRYGATYSYGTCSTCHDPLAFDGWCSSCSEFRDKFPPTSRKTASTEPYYGECPYCFDSHDRSERDATEYDSETGYWYCAACDSWIDWRGSNNYEVMPDPYNAPASDTDDETDAQWRVITDRSIAAD